MTTPSVKEVSKAILQKAGMPTSNLKLQKLLYYVQGWSLALYNKPAFLERIEAWVHGPVVPDAFFAYRQFRWNPITIPTDSLSLSVEELNHIGEVLSVYGSLSAVQLESLSHEESPWIDARKGLAPRDIGNVVIQQDAMKSYFQSRMNA